MLYFLHSSSLIKRSVLLCCMSCCIFLCFLVIAGQTWCCTKGRSFEIPQLWLQYRQFEQIWRFNCAGWIITLAYYISFVSDGLQLSMNYEDSGEHSSRTEVTTCSFSEEPDIAPCVHGVCMFPLHHVGFLQVHIYYLVCNLWTC